MADDHFIIVCIGCNHTARNHEKAQFACIVTNCPCQSFDPVERLKLPKDDEEAVSREILERRKHG